MRKINHKSNKICNGPRRIAQMARAGAWGTYGLGRGRFRDQSLTGAIYISDVPKGTKYVMR
jgi:hypothetical protein